MTAALADPRTKGAVVVPPVPGWVVVEMFEVGALAHQHIDGAERVPCGLKAWPFWLVPTAHAMRLRPRFCPTCWPGGRCQICGVPSGDSTECARCSAVSDRIDKAFARSES
jgi:hypothetical protein